MFSIEDLNFWIIAVGATLIKVATSARKSIGSVVVTVFAALFAAYVFTDPALAFTKLDPEVYRNPMAALMALTGEGLMRFIINLGNDPNQMVELWKKMKGK